MTLHRRAGGAGLPVAGLAAFIPDLLYIIVIIIIAFSSTFILIFAILLNIGIGLSSIYIIFI